MIYQDQELNTLYAKIQATEGTAETLNVAADAIDCYELTSNPGNEEIEIRRDRPFSGSRSVRTINHMLTTAGNIYLVGTDPWAAPRIGRILRACGHVETANTDDYTYTPTSNRSQLPFLTLRHDDGDYRYLVKDARGVITEFRFNMGEVPSAGFTIMAPFDASTDLVEAAMATPTYDAIQDPLSITTEASQLDLDGNEMHCYGLVVSTGRNNTMTRNMAVQRSKNDKHAATFTMRVMRTTLAVTNFAQMIRTEAKVPMLLDIAMATGTANLEFGAPVVQITGMQSEVIDEYKGIQVTGRILPSTGHDDYSLKLYRIP